MYIYINVYHQINLALLLLGIYWFLTPGRASSSWLSMQSAPTLLCQPEQAPSKVSFNDIVTRFLYSSFSGENECRKVQAPCYFVWKWPGVCYCMWQNKTEDTDVLILCLWFCNKITYFLYQRCAKNSTKRFLDIIKISCALRGGVSNAFNGRHASTIW